MATNKPGTNKEEASDPKAQNFQFCTRKCLQNVQSRIKKENVHISVDGLTATGVTS